MSRAHAWVLAAALAAGCSAPPWQIGAPLNGHPSIPPTGARPTPEEARATAALAHAAHQPAIELDALAALERSYRLDGVLPARPTAAETARLAELLAARAAIFHARARPIPESRDLEAVARLEPARGQALAATRAVAACAASEAWAAIDAGEDAARARALCLGLGGAPAGGARLPPPRDEPAPVPAPPDVDAWVLGTPALSVRLVPLAAAYPWVLDDVPRAVRWANLLVEEDPSSPDVLELVAFIFGRAGRFGGTERMLMELAFHSPDRADGLARGARVWERLGRTREACAQWIRAARWRDQAEDPLWLKAVACTRLDPGAGDWREIRAYVLDRATPDCRAALAATLDETDAAPARD